MAKATFVIVLSFAFLFQLVNCQQAQSQQNKLYNVVYRIHGIDGTVSQSQVVVPLRGDVLEFPVAGQTTAPGIYRPPPPRPTHPTYPTPKPTIAVGQTTVVPIRPANVSQQIVESAKNAVSPNVQQNPTKQPNVKDVVINIAQVAEAPKPETPSNSFLGIKLPSIKLPTLPPLPSLPGLPRLPSLPSIG